MIQLKRTANFTIEIYGYFITTAQKPASLLLKLSRISLNTKQQIATALSPYTFRIIIMA